MMHSSVVAAEEIVCCYAEPGLSYRHHIYQGGKEVHPYTPWIRHGCRALGERPKKLAMQHQCCDTHSDSNTLLLEFSKDISFYSSEQMRTSKRIN